MGTNSVLGCNIKIGSKYQMNVTKYGPGFKPYGLVADIPVVIGDIHDKGKNKDPFITQPGDSVVVRINDISQGVGFATVEERMGSYLKRGDRDHVTLTQQSKNDARDALSMPERDGGYSGVMAIVKKVDPRNHLDDSKRKICYVKIGALMEGRGGRRFLITNAVDGGQERPYRREVYVSQWPPLNSSESNEPLPEKDGIPIFEGLPKLRIGVPKDSRGFLYFGDGNLKKIFSQQSQVVDVSKMEPAGAVDTFYKLFGEEEFRAAFATPESIGLMRKAIELSKYNLIVEDLLV